MTKCLERFRVLLMTAGLLVAGSLIAQNADDDMGIPPPVDFGDEAVGLESSDLDRARDISATEMIGREERRIRAQGQMDKAQAALAAGTLPDLRDAADLAFEAEQLLRSVSATNPAVLEKLGEAQRLYATIVREWADTLVRQGEQMADEGMLDEAEELYTRALQRNEELRPLIQSRIARLEDIRRDVDIRQQTIPNFVDPERAERERDITIQLEQGKVFSRHRRYMDARDRFEAVLIRDPYNSEATRYLREIYEELSRTAKNRRHAMIRERIAEIDWKWNDPVAPVERVVAGPGTDTRRTHSRDDEGIRRKLSRIIIPRISFEDATIQTVVTHLKDRSKELDVDGQGVNIILRMRPDGAAAAAPGQQPQPALDTFDEFRFDDAFGLGNQPVIPDGFGDMGQAPAAADPGERRPGEQITVTMDMDNIPLGEAIRYICQAAGLKYRVEEHAVIIADPSVALEQLETRFYPIDAGFISAQATRGAGGGFGDDDNRQAAGGQRDAVDPKAFFEGFGIDFPQGARISHDARTSKLIVTNTPENLRRVEEILRELNVQPTQVTIEAKFVEVRQTAINQLGFSWVFQGKRRSDGSLGDYNRRFGSDLQFAVHHDSGSMSSGIDASIGGITKNHLFGVTSILDDLQFHTLIYAIDQMDGTDLLSAPKVTTTSGMTAVIDFVQERRFPDSFTEPQITTGTAGNVSVTPSTPEFGDSEEIGVIFRVTPTVAADGYSIDLELEPVVREFIGFDTTYNTQTTVEGVTIPFRFDTPIFERRSIQTRVIVWDGETVVLGGTIRDKIDKRDDRVPWLSDLPLLGRLFKMQGEVSEKRNLLVFVSARLVNPAGLPIRPSDIRGMPDFRR